MKAILQGIRSIKTDDIGKLNFAVLAAAARKFITAVEYVSNCEHCLHGFVVMRDEAGRCFALACTCEQGNMRQGLAKWNEKKTQNIHGRALTLR